MSEVTVVIASHERPEACARAVGSALAQTVPPLEVLICDNGSSPATLASLYELERADPRVRVLPSARNTGTPAPGRNRGVRAATGRWIALLDDDDRWFPEKLARQLDRVAAGDVDLVGTGALRSSGEPYFPWLDKEHTPTRSELVRVNPLITSSVLVRRQALLDAGLFPEGRWARGSEDYAMWLALSDRGARMTVLDTPLVHYEDAGDGRLSSAVLRLEATVALVFWRRCWNNPRDRLAWRAALAKTAAAVRLGAETVLRALRD